MSKKHAFLSFFAKIALFACVFCAFFIPSAFANLPAGYTELEYIESTGTQYIDTGLKGNNTYTYKFTYQKTEQNNPSALFGDLGGTAWNTGYYFAYSFVSANGTQSVAYFSDYIHDVPQSSNYMTNGVDLNKHTYECKPITQKQYLDGVEYVMQSSTTTVEWESNKTLFVFCQHNMSESGTPLNKQKLKVWEFSVKNGDVYVQNLIPARRNSDGEIGMYDTVSGTFFENAGTGDFIAGPIKYRNLFNKDNYMKTSDKLYVPAKGTGTTSISSDAASPYLVYIPVEPNATYSVMNFYSDVVPVRLRGCFTESVPAVGVTTISNEGVSAWDGVTPITLTNNAVGKYLVIQPCNASQLSQWDDIVSGLVVVENSVAPTSYVPYEYSTTEFEIKIATTKYVDDEFAPLDTALANAISVVDNVVTQTIAQATAIGELQNTKQTRPSDDNECPAGKKCLLVTDESGTPHWYEIIEP